MSLSLSIQCQKHILSLIFKLLSFIVIAIYNRVDASPLSNTPENLRHVAFDSLKNGEARCGALLLSANLYL